MCNTQKVDNSADATYLRKIRKPMIEKKRRERMNKSMSQLKALLMESGKENVAETSRWDKAEILDLTVNYLQQLRHRQTSATMATDVSKAYGSGFRDCAKTTMTYLTSAQCVNPTELSRLNNYLHNTYNEKMSVMTKSVPTHTASSCMQHPVSQRLSVTSGSSLYPSNAVQSSCGRSRAPHSQAVHGQSTRLSESTSQTSVNILHDEKPWRPW